ncbi:MAG: hypothetical protein QXN59_00170 [Candidatus Micrarchaeaceae archaeon]
MNLISADDLSKEEMNQIFEIADNLKEGREELALREHSVIALFFQHQLAKQKSPFEAAIVQLGSSSICITPGQESESTAESTSDIAKELSGYSDFIIAGINNHQEILKMASGASVPLINGISDLEHPTQALADLYTIKMYKNNLRNVKIAFMGNITSNVANSLMLFASRQGAEMALIGPKEVIPNSIYFNKSREYGKLDTFDSIDEGLEEADIIYASPFSDSGILASGAIKSQELSKYRVTKIAEQKADPNALIMHPLPIHRGEEIDADVVDGPKSIVWQQAKNRVLISKAILLYLSKGR